MTRRRISDLLMVFGVSVLTFVVTGFTGYMTFSTLAPLTPPIDPVGSEVEVGYSSTGIATVYETRHYKGSAQGEIQIQRHVYPKNSGSHGFIIEGGFIAAERAAMSIDGTFTVIRAIRLPLGTQGEWCSGADIVWYPILSLKAHRKETDDVCFLVEPK